MPKCIVKNCIRSSWRKFESTKKVRLYSLPSDKVKQKIWMKLAGRSSNFPINKNTKFCEDHFPIEVCHTQKCLFVGTNVLHTSCRCLIPEGKVPTLKLPGQSMNRIEDEIRRAERKKRRDNHKLVQELLETTPSTLKHHIQNGDPSVPCVIMNSTYPVEEGLQVFSESESESDPIKQEFEPSVFGLEDLCRVCALAATDMVGIFTTEGLHDKISLCLPVKIEEDDQLPSYVCRPCLSRIEDSYELAIKSLKAEAELRGILQEQQALFGNYQPNTEAQSTSTVPCNECMEIETDSNVGLEISNDPGEIGYTKIFNNSSVIEKEFQDDFNFVCEYCSATFNMKQKLIIHINQNHYKCKSRDCTCALIGRNKTILNDHDLHPFNNELNDNCSTTCLNPNVPKLKKSKILKCKMCSKLLPTRLN